MLFTSESELNTTTSTIHYYFNSVMDAVHPITRIGLLADETQFDQQLREGNPRTILDGAPDWVGVYKMIFESNLLLENMVPPRGSPKIATTIMQGKHTLLLASAISSSHVPMDKP